MRWSWTPVMPRPSSGALQQGSSLQLDLSLKLLQMLGQSIATGALIEPKRIYGSCGSVGQSNWYMTSAHAHCSTTCCMAAQLVAGQEEVKLLPCRKALGLEGTAKVDYQAVLQLQPSNKEAAEALQALQM